MFQSRPWLFAGIVLALLPILASRLSAHAADAPSPRMLLVVSSEGRDAGKSRPGFEMDEFAQAWLILRQNGFAIDVASPSGGKVEADRFNPEEPFNAAVLADPTATAALADTLPTQRIDPSRYAGVFVVGGKGAMFDLSTKAPAAAEVAWAWRSCGASVITTA